MIGLRRQAKSARELPNSALLLLLLVASFSSSLALLATKAQADDAVDIDPVQESQPNRSWAAVGEMIMRYYAVPNTGPNDDYQCGLANFLAGKDNAVDCAAPAKLSAYQAALKVVGGYSPYAYQFFKEDPIVMRSEQGKVLPPDELIHEIEFERPVVAAIEPPKVSAADKNTKEVALIIGYKGSADNLQLIINEPKVYEVGADPYIDAGATALDTGQYLMNYRDFIREMRWTASIYRIKPQ
ncbi:MAG: hypothetical protein ABWY00_07835 [Dongiaceae bacterium]